LERASLPRICGYIKDSSLSPTWITQSKVATMALKWVSSVKDKNYLEFFMEKQISKTFKKMAIVC